MLPWYTHTSDNTFRESIKASVRYLLSIQRPEGGWYGSWGICFTYATMFALEALALLGETYESSENVKRACDFLLEHQMDDGGWGESWEVCDLLDDDCFLHFHHPHSHV